MPAAWGRDDEDSWWDDESVDMKPRRWMLFVDVENFVGRAQALMKRKGVPLTSGSHYNEDVFVWMPGMPPTAWVLPMATLDRRPYAIPTNP